MIKPCFHLGKGVILALGSEVVFCPVKQLSWIRGKPQERVMTVNSEWRGVDFSGPHWKLKSIRRLRNGSHL